MYFRLCKNCFILAARMWTDLIVRSDPGVYWDQDRTGLQPRKKVLKPCFFLLRSIKYASFDLRLTKTKCIETQCIVPPDILHLIN